MSDGPHRSLSLPKHWRKVAQRAERAACSPAEINETLEDALTEDFQLLPDPLQRAWLIQPEVFSSGGSPTTALGTVLVEQIQRFRNGGAPSLTDYRRALVAALTIVTGRHVEAMEELWLRHQNDSRARSGLERIRRAVGLTDCDVLAERLSSHPSGAPASYPVRKRTGVEEGPELPESRSRRALIP